MLGQFGEEGHAFALINSSSPLLLVRKDRRKFMAIMYPDHPQDSAHELVQISSDQYKELSVLAAELGSSVAEIVETIISLMLRDNYSQLKSAIAWDEKWRRTIESPEAKAFEAAMLAKARFNMWAILLDSVDLAQA
jgi:hypothetical protein